jgi:PTH1 family peptidyl-tRNA hydrolase
MRFVVGLGNDLKALSGIGAWLFCHRPVILFWLGTRHNVGADALVHIVQLANLQWTTMRDISCYVAVDNALQITYLRPKCAMNDSGKPVRKALQHFRAAAADCLVVHDDLERAVGKVSVKSGGGAAGHNGIRSITQCLSTESFPRVRVGIGRPADRSQVASFVLESFPYDETELLRTTCVCSLSPSLYSLLLLCFSFVVEAYSLPDLLLRCCG